jgi:hypothetical protein
VIWRFRGEKGGFFGTDGRFSFEGEPQIFKIPHLRNMYQKVGKFGMPRAPLFLPESFTGADNAFMGDQVRGFGFLHDGSVDTLNRFHSTVLFVQRPAGAGDPGNPDGFALTPEGFLATSGRAVHAGVRQQLSRSSVNRSR